MRLVCVRFGAYAPFELQTGRAKDLGTAAAVSPGLAYLVSALEEAI